MFVLLYSCGSINKEIRLSIIFNLSVLHIGWF
nr:MAG TPA: hypothetical protein [Caudoviricetes sp.]